MNQRLTAIPFDGLNTDCLGNYLAALGTLAAISQRWNGVRGCWRDRRFVVLSDDPKIELGVVKQFLLKEWRATDYARWWNNIQKADTKAKSSTGIWRERSERSMSDVRVLDAHLVGNGRNKFNPVLGTGGNVGKRDLAKAFKDAQKLLTEPDAEAWLDTTLFGTPNVGIPDLSNGGTWFVHANKMFNSGQGWYREGLLSPWSQILATEGAFLLVGGVNRRLGSRSRPYAVFPFVSEPCHPATDGEIGLSRAEFWAPLWTFPATLTEVRSLFQRGLAKLGGRPAQAPHEFAVAAVSAGVDSGVAEFARFELRQTTSSQVYEAIPRPRIRVQSGRNSCQTASGEISPSPLLVHLIESRWMDRLPFEPRKSNQKGKFVGLRGPIESAIVQIAERPADAERWQHLLLRLAASQARIDRNKTLRERCLPLPPLSSNWFALAWPEPTPEVLVARAIASIGWHNDRDAIPLLENVFGVTLSVRGRTWRSKMPKTRTAQAVWASGDPLQNLLNLAQRRLMDAEGLPRTPFAGTCSCSGAIIQQFLSIDGGLDPQEIAKWIPPLSLIDWSSSSRETNRLSPSVQTRPSAEGTALLHALVRPLFHVDENTSFELEPGEPLFRSDQLPKANLLRCLFHLLRFGSIDEAVQVLRDRYLAVGRAIVMPPGELIADGERIAAALLIPMRHHDVRSGLQRWLQPSRNR